MKKYSSIVMLILMLLQVLSPVVVLAETIDDQIIEGITKIELEKNNLESTGFSNDEELTILINWVSGQDTHFELPNELKINQELSGDLVAADNSIVGTYHVATTGRGQLHFTKKEMASGKISLLAQINDQKTGHKKYQVKVNQVSKFIDVEIMDQYKNGTKDSVSESQAEESNVSESSQESSVQTELSNENKTNEINSDQPKVSKAQESEVSTEASTEKSSIKIDQPKAKKAKVIARGAGNKIDYDLITGVILKDGNGKIIGGKDTPKPGIEDDVSVEFEFTLKDNSVFAGDYYEFKMPNQFEVLPHTEFDLISEGQVIGQVIVDPETHTARLDFFEAVEEQSQISGSFHIGMKFNKQLVKESTKQKIVFPLNKDLVTDIQFKTTKGESISKAGQATARMNAKEINWQLDLNKEQDKIENALFTDELPEGLTLNTDSVKLSPLNVNIDGTTNLFGQPLIPGTDYVVEVTGNKFQIKFIQPKDLETAFHLEYQTAIDPKMEAPKGYKNQAKLTGTNEVKLSASATVASTKGHHLKKSNGRLEESREGKERIGWNIEYNYDEATVPVGTILTDVLEVKDGDRTGVSSNLDPSSVHVAVIDVQKWAMGRELKAGEDYEVAETETGFTIKWLKELKEAVRIDYDTFVTGKDGLISESGEVFNKITDEWGQTSSGSGQYQQVLFVKTNEIKQTDTHDKTTVWKLAVNQNNQHLNNVVIEDLEMARQNLELVEESLVIKQGDQDVTNQVIVEKGPKGFKISFKESITSSYTIEYETIYSRNPVEKQYFNEAKMSWTYQDGSKGHTSSTARFVPDTYDLNDGYKTGSYNAVTKKINWQVAFNYDEQHLVKAVLTDILEDNQKINPDSIAIYHGDMHGHKNDIVEGQKLIAGKDYAVSIKPGADQSKEVLEISFLKAIDDAYILDFETSIEGSIIHADYLNKAILSNQGKDTGARLEGKVTVKNGDKLTTKQGVQNNEWIDWSININESQSTIEKAVILDTPTVNQTIEKESFHLFEKTVNEAGDITINRNKELAKEAYQLEFTKNDQTGQENFTLSFNQTINQAYVLEYQTIFSAGNHEKVSNNVHFSGSNVETITQESTKEVTVVVASGGSDVEGEKGSLKIIKVDEETKEPLAGAIFEVHAKVKNVDKLIAQETTNAQGEISFDDLAYREYTLIEMKAPEGYNLGENRIVKVNSEEEQVVVVPNKKQVHEVKLVKVDDQTGQKLAGAVFKLQQKNGEIYQDVKKYSSVKTNQEGAINLKDLPAGEYQFIEEQAPTGYQLTQGQQVFPFKIENNQTESITVKVANKMILGAINFEKTDAKTGQSLSGAEFKITAIQSKEQADSEFVAYSETVKTNEDGKLSFENLRPGKYQIQETKAPKGYKLSDEIYTEEVRIGQDSKNIPVVHVKNDVLLGSLKVVKKDGKTLVPLMGAEFQLTAVKGADQEDNLVPYQGSLKTDYRGELVFNQLRPGQYELKEMKAPFGYQLSDQVYPVRIDLNQTVIPVIEATNQIILGEIDLVKMDAVTKENLSGAEFQLKAVEVSGQASETFVPHEEKATTDEQGKLTFAKLRPGTYEIKEIKAPKGYQLSDTIYTQVVKLNQTKTEVPVVEATNEILLGEVRLTKTDEVTGELLEGVVFELQTTTGEVVQTGQTDPKGVLTFSHLRPGNYQIVETKAAKNYQLESKKYPVKVSLNQTVAEIPNLQIKNKLITGKIKVVKQDHQTGKHLKNATIELQTKDGALVKTAVTDDKGEAEFSDIRPGKYQVVETKAPKGYQLDHQSHPVTVVASQTARAIPLIEVEDDIVRGKIRLEKTDSVTKKPLAGATFELQTLAGEKVEDVAPQVTDEEGQLLFDNIRPGDYQVVEMKAPVGYIRDETPKKVSVNLAQKAEEVPMLKVENQIKLGQIKLIKTDNQTREVLAGAVFQITQKDSQEVIETKTTDKSGQISFNDLRPGNYQITEVVAPENYELDTTPKLVEVILDQTAGDVPIITVENQIKLGKIELVKSDAETGQGLVDAIYQLQSVDENDIDFANHGNQAHVIQKSKTDAQGKILFEDVRPGHYQVVEVKAPTDYQIDSQPYPVTVDFSPTETVKIEVTDIIVKGSVEIIKQDHLTKELLAGAEFKITALQGEQTDQEFVPVTKTEQTATEGSNKGKLVFSDLRPGEYQIQEITAPTDYQLDETIYHVTIDRNQTSVPVMTIDNQLKLGSLEITKVDSDSNQVLVGAEFNLEDESGEVVKSGRTNEEGQLLFEKLRPGNYQLVETKAPVGYRQNSEKLAVVIERSQTTTLGLTVKNTRDLGSVRLTKVDSQNQNKPLSEAVFNLYDAQGIQIKAELVTNQKGLIEVNQLTPGNYYFVETKAPQGYQLEKGKKIEFTIVENSQSVIEVIVQNTRKPIQPNQPNDQPKKEFKVTTKATQHLPKTGEQKAMGTLVIGFLLLGVSILFWLVRGKYKQAEF